MIEALERHLKLDII